MKTLLLRLHPSYRPVVTRKPITRRLSGLALLTGFMLSGSFLFAQDRHYSFSVQGITDYGRAKEITDILRPLFNTEAAPFTYFPAFDDNRDAFDFHSAVTITRDQLLAVLQQHGLVLTAWTSEIYITDSEKQ